ncbi:MAG: hypothetical protein EA362_03850 [Saprospirales bacterium]|nr:MAG: hypothetical protein EA362_03850 [Saprospirales bacterium]
MAYRRWTKDYLGRGYMKYFAIFALIFIPLYTWLFATKESPFYYTMSMIGNQFDYRLNFIVWGTVTGFLLTFYISRLYVLKSFDNKRANRLLIWSHVFLILTVSIPAVEHLPFLKTLHAVMAVMFGLSLLTSLYLFIRFLGEINEQITIKSMWFLTVVLAGSIGLFFLLGNTGVFELFFFFSLVIFLAVLRRWLKPYEESL